MTTGVSSVVPSLGGVVSPVVLLTHFWFCVSCPQFWRTGDRLSAYARQSKHVLSITKLEYDFLSMDKKVVVCALLLIRLA